MRSLMYRSPTFYMLALKIIHGKTLRRRYSEIRRIAGNRRVFEAGCGPGMLGDYVGKDRYSGMDLNEGFVRYARRKGYDCVVGDILRDRYPEADVGVLVDVLHHITPREKELLERMRRQFETVIVVEPVDAFNLPLPRFLRRIWDSTFGDADGINPLDNRERWRFTEDRLMDYMRGMGAERVYPLGKDVVAVFRGERFRDG